MKVHPPWNGRCRCLRRCGYIVGCFGQWAWRLHHCCFVFQRCFCQKNGLGRLWWEVTSQYVGSIYIYILCLEVGTLTCDLWLVINNLKQVYIFDPGSSIDQCWFVLGGTRAFYNLCVFFNCNLAHIYRTYPYISRTKSSRGWYKDAYEGLRAMFLFCTNFFQECHGCCGKLLYCIRPPFVVSQTKQLIFCAAYRYCFMSDASDIDITSIDVLFLNMSFYVSTIIYIRIYLI